MSQTEEKPSEGKDVANSSWSGRIEEAGQPSLSLNVLTGIVTSRTIGLTRTTLRIRVGERTDLRVRWHAPLPTRDTVEIGQTVYLTIPAEAVHLEAGGFRRGKQRWNRWIGRVVLVSRNDEHPVTTVKLNRDSITLNSVGVVLGGRVPLTAWDTVNIVVDPQQVRLASIRRPYSWVTPSPSSSFLDSHPSPVWLWATVQSVRSLPAGLLVTLNVGGVSLSAMIENGSPVMPSWTVGTSVEISIDRCDARIRPFAEGPIIPCSVLLSSEIGVHQLSVPIQEADT